MIRLNATYYPDPCTVLLVLTTLSLKLVLRRTHDINVIGFFTGYFDSPEMQHRGRQQSVSPAVLDRKRQQSVDRTYAAACAKLYQIANSSGM